MAGAKEELRRLLEQLPDDLSWDDLMHVVYVRTEIEAGLRDADEGRTMSLDEVRRHFANGNATNSPP